MRTISHGIERSLTLNQQRAIELLLSGASNQHVADQIGMRREAVSRWRNHHPIFQVELSRRQAELRTDVVDGFRAAFPAALATLTNQLDVGRNRGRLALDFLRGAGLFDTLTPDAIGPTSIEDLIDAEIRRRRAAFDAVAKDDAEPPITDTERTHILSDLLTHAQDGDASPAHDSVPTAPSPLHVASTPTGLVASTPDGLIPIAPAPVSVSAPYDPTAHQVTTRSMSSFS